MGVGFTRVHASAYSAVSVDFPRVSDACSVVIVDFHHVRACFIVNDDFPHVSDACSVATV